MSPASAPGLGVPARKLSDGIPNDVEGVLGVFRRGYPKKKLPSHDCILLTKLGVGGIDCDTAVEGVHKVKPCSGGLLAG